MDLKATFLMKSSQVSTSYKSSGLAALCLLAGAAITGSIQASECDLLSSDPSIVWCDDFEDSDLPDSGRVSDNYVDYQSDGGRLARTDSFSKSGSFSLKQSWRNRGDVSAGYFFRTFGRSPFASQSNQDTDYREIFWRLYVLYPQGTSNIPNKLTRATVFANASRAQAMIGHVWLERTGGSRLMLDPASGTDEAGNLLSTGWNDFDNLRWLGQRVSSRQIIKGEWQCVEAHVSLNSPGNSDGQFRLWIDNELVAESSTLNWVGSYSEFGINAIMVSSYWNDGGAPRPLTRYLDSFVIATERIGCHTSPSSPRDMSNLN